MSEHRADERRRARRRAASVAGGLALILASTAAANGRFPRAQRLIQDALEPRVMALYGTYGLLVTRDAGASWYHVCEAATGPYAGEDPLLEIMADQRIVLRTDTGLSRSDASACGYTTVLGGTSQPLQDITRDSLNPNGLLSLSTALGDDGVFVSSLAASSDGGASFTALASVPGDILELGLTLDVAANQPNLLYVSGLDSLGRGKLARSTNRGQSFVGFEIPGLGASAPPYIAAVSASDPGRVFVRSDVYSRADDDFEARETADDSLYFSPDGGETWHRSLNKRGKLYGFALSPDERWVLAGFGDPVLPAIFVEPDELGLYRVALADLVAAPDDPPWERIYARGVTCLRWTEDALFACVAQDENDFELGRAADASFSLADTTPFAGLLRLPEVRPLECPAETTGAACLTDEVTGWQATCAVLRAQCSLDEGAGGASGAGPSDPGGAGAAGSNDSPVDPLDPDLSATMGGSSAAPDTNGEGGAASASGEGPGPGDSVRAPSKSGSCSIPRATAGRASWTWPCALIVLATRRRAKRIVLGLSLVLAALSLIACSDQGPSGDGASGDGNTGANEDSEGDAQADATRSDCGGAGEAFMLGMSKTTASGVHVAIESAEPAPPLSGNNVWTLALTDASGEPVTGADVAFSGWMPRHRHGLTALPLTVERENGRYEIRPIVLFMPQPWELSVAVTAGAGTEDVTFDICVP